MGGFIDGEGALSIARSTSKTTGYVSYRSVVGFSNTNPNACKWAVKHFGGVFRKRERPEYSDSACFEWYLTGNRAQKSFLETVRPYVRFKAEQIDILLEYLGLFKQLVPKKRDALYNRMAEVHHNFSVETDTLDPLGKTGRSYYAALLDGEGTITISEDRFGYYRPAVRVYNSNLALLTPLKSSWGGSIHEAEPGFYQWHINKKTVIEKFLLYSTPYLLIKRSQAKTMLEYVRLSRKWNRPERKRLYESLSYLNNLKVKIQSELAGDRESELAGTPIS